MERGDPKAAFRKAIQELLALTDSDLRHLEQMVRQTIEVSKGSDTRVGLIALHNIIVAAMIQSSKEKRETKPGIGIVRDEDVVQLGEEWNGPLE